MNILNTAIAGLLFLVFILLWVIPTAKHHRSMKLTYGAFLRQLKKMLDELGIVINKNKEVK